MRSLARTPVVVARVTPTASGADVAPLSRRAACLGFIAFHALFPESARARAPDVVATARSPVANARSAANAYYFANGCFWGRQHTFYDVERALGRSDDEVTSVVGYAGGRGGSGTADAVCYYYGPSETVYERLGHCEAVSVTAKDENELRAFADAYFASFQKVPGIGMQRVDPQDAGPGYRNAIGIPGGMASPAFAVIEAANVHKMKLVAGQGNGFTAGKPTETDVVNSVWIYDSNALPFYQAEVYHQFHDGLGYKFPLEYTQGVKRNALQRGLIATTGCPEMRERAFAEFISASA